INNLKRGKYNEEGKFLPRVLRIAHNLTIDHFRKGKKMPAVRSDEDNDVFAMLSQDELSVEDKMCWDQILDDVMKVMDHLPADQKEVVHQRLFQGMSFKEIAERNDISINTALGRMRYALINMRKVIAEHKMNLSMS
ncbi:MAG: sigma-70 family RNA polymerase sigma factor, partial [Flavobacteriales bacterium]|nr:sigma-70 family RNA polymerase sigma factor [Flavobacteriales bacterium]